MSVNSNKKFTGSNCMAVIMTLAQDESDTIDPRYIEYALRQGASARKLPKK